MKIYRMSQIHQVLGPSVHSLDMYKFGLPYFSASGSFRDDLYPGSVDLMLAAAEAFSEIIHPSSHMSDGRILNRYTEGAWFYQLRYGNADPDIVITNERSKDDYPPGEYREFLVIDTDEFYSELTPEELKAIERSLNRKVAF